MTKHPTSIEIIPRLLLHPTRKIIFWAIHGTLSRYSHIDICWLAAAASFECRNQNPNALLSEKGASRLTAFWNVLGGKSLSLPSLPSSSLIFGDSRRCGRRNNSYWLTHPQYHIGLVGNGGGGACEQVSNILGWVTIRPPSSIRLSIHRMAKSRRELFSLGPRSMLPKDLVKRCPHE